MHDHQERTEQATPKRVREAAERGQIPRSRELTTFAMLCSAAAGLLLLGPHLLARLAEQMRATLSLSPHLTLENNILPAAFAGALINALLTLGPLLALLVLAAFVAPMALGGWSFSSKALSFKPERLNPAKGLKRIFSWRALMELGKALAKFLIVAAIAVIILWQQQSTLLQLGGQPLLPALADAAELLSWTFLILTLPLLLIAAVDVPFQLYEHARQLRMTKQEVREEMKETEGKPEVKSRIRRLQQEFAQRRMMDKVPQADVVITNPTHFAVALKYQHNSMNAPIMVAKGADQVAARIRLLAAEHSVPQVEAPLLARAIYFNVDLDQPIPDSLYLAVAQVLAYVYQLREAHQLSDRPIPMSDLPVPPSLRTK